MARQRWMLTWGLLLLAAAAPASAGWSPLGGPVSEPEIEVQVHPGRPQLLYARVIASVGPEEGYLWRSEDAGKTWTNVQRGLERPSSALAIDPADPEVIWVWTSDNQLWRSGDAGETWSRRFATPADQIVPLVFQLLVDPRRPETIYRVDYDGVGTGTRVAVSRDGGASFQAGAWVPHFTGLDSIFPHPIRAELISFDEKGLEVSADDGQTWSVRSAFGTNGFVSGRLAPSAPDTLYGVPYDPAQCLARSDDVGAHWVTLPRPSLPLDSARCVDVAIDPRDPRHVWVFTEAFSPTLELRVFESRDGGNTWSPPRTPPAFGVVAAGGDVIYNGIATEPYGPGLHVSMDGGQTWQPRHRGIAAGDLRGGFVAQGLPDGIVGRRLVALDTKIGGGPLGLFRSDGGKDWVKLPFQEPYQVIDAGRPALLALTAQGVFRSQDGGATWSTLPSAPRGAVSLQSSSTQPRYVALEAFKDVGDFGKIAFWTSDNGGMTWRQSSQGLPLSCTHVASVDWCPSFRSYTVDPFDARRRWLVSGGGFPFTLQFFLSEDSGASWHSMMKNPPTILALAADPAAKGRLLAGTDDRILVSGNGGRRWRRLGSGLPEGAAVRQLARDPRSGTWYAATTDRGIFRSLDDGSTWTQLEGAPDHDAPTIVVDPRRPTALLAAFRGQGVWRWTP
jgi:photosystem II stability/assembly factor-like uncharacterized protein